MDNKKVYNLVGTIETRVSTKTGKEYTALFLKLNEKYEKIVFLSEAEKLILNSKN